MGSHKSVKALKLVTDIYRLSYGYKLNTFSLGCYQINTKLSSHASSVSESSVRQLTSSCNSELAAEMDRAGAVSPAERELTNMFSEKDHSSESLEQQEEHNNTESKLLSKRALKRIARAQKHKEYKRQKRIENLQLIQKDEAGFSVDDLKQSSYYFENGVRKVYPYTYVFATHAKGRWVGCKIQDVLEKEFGYDQPDQLMKSFEQGMIHVNGKLATADYILQDNDYISHKTHRHENPVTAAPIEIIEESDDLVVINKPASIPCHPCGRYRFNSVVFIMGKEMGLINLRHIYRLDRLTSGILIMGKSPVKTRILIDQVTNRQVQKEYVCRVVGKFPDGPVTVDQPLTALSNKLRLQVVSPAGKPSQTTFTRISYNGKSSVVRCMPHTGRTHQIRVHLQYLGHPILNDAFYNSRAWGPNRGKNGIYDVPFNKVCEQILSEHHEKLWTGGDNPLYEAKLKEMKGKMVNVDSSAITEELHDKCGSSQTEIMKEDKGHIASVQPENSCSDKDAKRSCSASENINIGLDSADHSQVREPVKDAAHDKNPSRCLPEFEMSKWSVDTSCENCKIQQIDPEEKHLVMFLHAIKYQGPDWMYETALPDWANESWSREEDFILENSS